VPTLRVWPTLKVTVAGNVLQSELHAPPLAQVTVTLPVNPFTDLTLTLKKPPPQHPEQLAGQGPHATPQFDDTRLCAKLLYTFAPAPH